MQHDDVWCPYHWLIVVPVVTARGHSPFVAMNTENYRRGAENKRALIRNVRRQPGENCFIEGHARYIVLCSHSAMTLNCRKALLLLCKKLHTDVFGVMCLTC